MAQWRPDVCPIPQQSDNAKVRDFIKKKYVDLLWVSKEVRGPPRPPVKSCTHITYSETHPTCRNHQSLSFCLSVCVCV
jgi:hypothetical protein